jgi:hypothetical protein
MLAGVTGEVAGDFEAERRRFRAAAIMGQLRTASATMAHLGRPPGAIMGQLSRLAAGHAEDTGATCLYALYDPASRRCRFTSGGHLPPALREPGGGVEFIDVPTGVMLSAGPSRYPVTDIRLPPGRLLALYTDGLIERPGQDLGTGMPRLAGALATGPARSLDDLCDSVLARLGPSPGMTRPCSPAPPPVSRFCRRDGRLLSARVLRGVPRGGRRWMGGWNWGRCAG